MKLVLFLLFVFWFYNYWRFMGKRKAHKQLVIVAEHRYSSLKSVITSLDLACAYMQAQRYADAYAMFSKTLSDYPNTYNADDIRTNMEFCKKPLPWSGGLKNHNMGYWHNFMLVRFGGRRRIMISPELIMAADNFNNLSTSPF